MRKLSSLLFIIVFFLVSCDKTQDFPLDSTLIHAGNQAAVKAGATSFLENFETGTKTAYATANVTLTTGIWNLNDALLGNSSSDVKDGTQSARVRDSGILTMEFDKTTGAGTVTIYSAKYGSDANTTWQL